jgi:hypothetical protein
MRRESPLDVYENPFYYEVELVKRGYAFTGLDISKAMLDYTLKRRGKLA